jgi:hypothetical protein
MFPSNEPVTGGSITPVLPSTQYELHKRVCGLNMRSEMVSNGTPFLKVVLTSMLLIPPRNDRLFTDDSFVVQSLFFCNLFVRRLLSDIQSPTRNSKSFLDELAEGMT